MPVSFAEARGRALALSREVQAQATPTSGAAPSTPTSVDKGRHKRRRSLTGDGPDSPLSEHGQQKRRRSLTGDGLDSPLSEHSQQMRKAHLAAASPEHSSPTSKTALGLLLLEDDKQKDKASQQDLASPCSACGQLVTEERRLGRHCASCLLVPGELGGSAAAGA